MNLPQSKVTINGVDLFDFPLEMVIKHARDTGKFESFSMSIWREIAQYQGFSGLFIDGGCYSGIYAIAALSNLSNRAWAFDINPTVLEWARHNAKLNKVSKRISICNSGLSNYVGSGSVSLAFPTSSACKIGATGKFRVPVSTIDQMIILYGRPIKLQGLKLDLEGEEQAALAGASKTISRDRPFVICECLTQSALSAVEKFFADLDYSTTFISSDGNLIAWCPDRHRGFGGLT